MRTYSFNSALERHTEITQRPVSVTALLERFDPKPPESTRALLIRMGPLVPATDAFEFENDLPITIENAEQYLRFFSREVVEEAAALATKPFGDFLRDLSIPVPLAPDITLPSALIDLTVTRVQTEALGFILDVGLPPLGCNFGRCGGMAFAGYDFYQQGRTVAGPGGFGSTIPPEDEPLDEYLVDRLLDSLDLNGRTFLDWWATLHLLPQLGRVATVTLLANVGSFLGPLGAVVGAFIGTRADIFEFGGPKPLLDRTKVEWPRIKRRLDEQAAWPVGLIYGDETNLFNQHQVLAIGYTETGLGTASLEVWDNEEGNKGRKFDLDFRGDELIESGFPDHRIKGVFAEEYQRRVPPL